MAYHSKALKRVVDIDDLAEITSVDEIVALWHEVGEKLSSVNADLLQIPRYLDRPLTPRQTELMTLRTFLAPFHQRIAHRRSQLRGDNPPRRSSPIRGESPHSDAIASVPSVESLYVQAARQELEPAVHQRLLLIAEQRRNVSIAQATGLAVGG